MSSFGFNYTQNGLYDFLKTHTHTPTGRYSRPKSLFSSRTRDEVIHRENRLEGEYFLGNPRRFAKIASFFHADPDSYLYNNNRARWRFGHVIGFSGEARVRSGHFPIWTYVLDWRNGCRGTFSSARFRVRGV